MQPAPEKAAYDDVVCFILSTSFKVIEICTSKLACNFLVVFYRCAYRLSFQRYNDLLVENLRFCAAFTTPVSFEALVWGFPWA